MDLSKLLEKVGDVSAMTIDETKGATVVFVTLPTPSDFWSKVPPQS